MFPGLRVGFLVAPPPLVDAIAAARASLAAPASAINQAALTTFIADGHFATHLRRMRAAYRERSEALIAGLRTDCAGALTPDPCDTGMQLTATLDLPLSDVRVREEAAELGVEAAALSDYFIDKPRRAGLVLGFGATRPSAVRAGTRSLAQAIEAARRN